MGGLVVSTFLTSILLPTLAALSEDGFAAIGNLPRRLLSKVPSRKATSD